jgi:hypothetical protein
MLLLGAYEQKGRNSMDRLLEGLFGAIKLVAVPASEAISLADLAKTGARNNFEKYGKVLPVAFLEVTAANIPQLNQDERGIVILPADFPNATAKDFFSMKVRFFCKHFNALSMAFVSECWTVHTTNRDDVEGYDSLEHHPDRQEVVNVSYETKEGKTELFSALISDIEGKRSLEEFRSSGMFDVMEGRFVSFFTHDAQA